MVGEKRGRPLWLAWLLVSAGCVTALPMQTASTVPRGAVRLGGELAAATWCTLSANPLVGCALSPSSAPLPEVRFDVRYGAAEALDVGGSLRATGVLSRGVEVGLSLDGRKELWSRPIGPEQRQIITVGPTLGLDASTPVGETGTVGGIVAKLTLPAYLGHQTDGFEWVLSPRLVGKLTRPATAAHPVFVTGEFGLALAVFSRGQTRWGAQLSYHAPLDYPASGLIVFAAGLQVDLGLPAPPPAPIPVSTPAPL